MVICLLIALISDYIAENSWLVALINNMRKIISWLWLHAYYLHTWIERKVCSLYVLAKQLWPASAWELANLNLHMKWNWVVFPGCDTQTDVYK